MDTLSRSQPGVAVPASNDNWQQMSAHNLAASWVKPTRAMGKRTLDLDGVRVADPGSRHPLPNSATLLRPLATEAAPALIAHLRRFYAAGAGGPWALWSAWPTPDLRPLGCTLMGEPPLMVRRPGGASPAAPPDLRIEEVADATTLAAFERVMVEGYPLPELQPFRPGVLFTPAIFGGRFRLWVGSVAGTPVTCAAAYVGEEAVGVYCVATMPEARGRGYGSVITDHAARADPALPAVLQASDLGRPIYERLGFTVVSRFALWIAPRQG